MPALPPVNLVFRADIHMQNNIGQKYSLRNFFTFSGGTPGPATCTTFGTAWGNSFITNILPIVANSQSITGVTVTDLTSASAATGSVSLTGAGTRGVASVPAWITACLAATAGPIVIGNHVSVSYYQGFKPFTTSSGRVKNISQVRTPPIPIDIIGSSTVNTIPGSQRRRYQR